MEPKPEQILALLEEIRGKFGDSSDESRKIVIEAFGGVERLSMAAEHWWKFHFHEGYNPFVMFATAVDLGVRIGRRSLR